LALLEGSLIAMFNAVSATYQKMGYCFSSGDIIMKGLYELCTQVLSNCYSQGHTKALCVIALGGAAQNYGAC